jgi:hypothetical protein
MKRLAFPAIVACLAVCALTGSGRAGLISGTITGEVTSAGSNVPGITIGSLVTGSYTFDDAATVNEGNDTINPFTAFSLSIGTNPHVFSLPDLLMEFFEVPGRSVPGSIPGTDSLFFLFDPGVLESYVDGPLNPFDFEGIESSLPLPQEFDVNGADPSHSFVFDFTATPVPTAAPEPASLTLVGVGTVAVVGYGWRKRWRTALGGRLFA